VGLQIALEGFVQRFRNFGQDAHTCVHETALRVKVQDNPQLQVWGWARTEFPAFPLDLKLGHRFILCDLGVGLSMLQIITSCHEVSGHWRENRYLKEIFCYKSSSITHFDHSFPRFLWNPQFHQKTVTLPFVLWKTSANLWKIAISPGENLWNRWGKVA
jgi:hypothetical protein